MNAITALINSKEKDFATDLALVEGLIQMRQREYEKQTRELSRDLDALERRRKAILTCIEAGRNYTSWMEALA